MKKTYLKATIAALVRSIELKVHGSMVDEIPERAKIVYPDGETERV